MLMDACLMIGVVVNDIAHVMMPSFAAAMLVVVFSHFIIDDLPGAMPAGAFALVFACLARGAPARKPMKWNLATLFFSLQGLLLLLVGIGMLFGDDSVIPEQMKPLDSLSQLKLDGTTLAMVSKAQTSPQRAGSAAAGLMGGPSGTTGRWAPHPGTTRRFGSPRRGRLAARPPPTTKTS